MDKKTQIELIGQNISSLRVKANLTQEELAELIDVSKSFLAHVEAGQKCFSVYRLRLLADALHVSMDALFYGDGRDVIAKNIAGMLVDKSREEPDAIERVMHTCADLYKIDVQIGKESQVIHGKKE